MLSAYNSVIDQMYDYKREMAGENFTGKGSYRNGDAVRAFNRNNKAVYGSANDPNKGVHGYSEKQEGWNGTSTAQRFIDITDDNISDLNFNFDANDSEEFRNLLNGIVKDKTGRYFVNTTSIEGPSTPSLADKFKLNVNPDVHSVVNPAGANGGLVNPAESGNGGGEPQKKGKFDFKKTLPGLLDLSRYYAALANNRDVLNMSKRMPVMLYDPKERHRWLFGDEQAVISGRRSAGKLNHISSTPISSDGQAQQAAMMEGLIKGQEFIRQGEAQDNNRRMQTAEMQWNQEAQNQQSRYDIAVRNRQNLFQKDVSDLQAEMGKRRADFESTNNLLAEIIQDTRRKQYEHEYQREQVEQASVKNDILANMEAYGIPATSAEQQLINDLMTGARKGADVTEKERESYARLLKAVNEEAIRISYAKKGLDYRPFKPRTSSPSTSGFTSDIVGINKSGGKITAEDRVHIQRMRNKVAQMKQEQKALDKRIDAYQKDIDRMQKSASGYIREQKTK